MAKKAKLLADDDIDDICEEFGVDPAFVRFTWAVLKQIGGYAPGSKFFPRNMRECALASACALIQTSEQRENSRRGPSLGKG